MQKLPFIIFSLITMGIYGQNSEIENLINHVANREIPQSFEYYFLYSRSMEQPKINDSLQNFQIREIEIADHNFPLDLIYERTEEKIDWREYELQKVKYVVKKYNYDKISPPLGKSIKFVNFNIGQKKYDSLVEHRKPHCIIVKKKWHWNKNKIWSNKKLKSQITEAWKLDEKKNPEERVYFNISKPLFSEDKKYAKISIFESRRCFGDGFTSLYRKENGTWKKVFDYNRVSYQVTTTHSPCGGISISSYD